MGGKRYAASSWMLKVYILMDLFSQVLERAGLVWGTTEVGIVCILRCNCPLASFYEFISQESRQLMTHFTHTLLPYLLMYFHCPLECWSSCGPYWKIQRRYPQGYSQCNPCTPLFQCPSCLGVPERKLGSLMRLGWVPCCQPGGDFHFLECGQ